MRSFCKLATVMLALIGASVACALASPAFAAKPANQRQHHGGADLYGTPARYASPIYRCKGGRHYTYAGGWGCDYYVCSESSRPGDARRRSTPSTPSQPAIHVKQRNRRFRWGAR
jgi:hypothetical protein